NEIDQDQLENECNEILENEKCKRCEREEKSFSQELGNNYYLADEEVVLVSVPTADIFGGPIEFAKDPNKEMHIHVLGEKGSMKVRLNPVERDTDRPTDIPPNLERKLIRFVADNIIDIKRRIREELEKRNIKVPPF
ncbi:26696_t:CDS:2, partial [Racocetra persica]